MMSRFLCLGLLVVVVGCGDDDIGDAAVPDATSCTTNSQCDDGTFCNGPESCSGGVCMPGQLPCMGRVCDEGTQMCGETCADADNDGQTDMACGGQDCDDSNPNRFAGNTEICDANDVDEDCDPTTFGFRDDDGDSSPSAACCNEAADGSRACGSDCDDSVPNINPQAPEVCDRVDNDCDLSIDEGVIRTLYRDDDGDLFGTNEESMMGCPGDDPAWVVNGGDCRDNNPAINPGVGETCADGIDNDCDPTTTDEGQQIECYADEDADSFTLAGLSRLCAPSVTSPCPQGYKDARSDETDCCDTDDDTYPRSGNGGDFFTEKNTCGKFDYNCDEVTEQKLDDSTLVDKCSLITTGSCSEFWEIGGRCGSITATACQSRGMFLRGCEANKRTAGKSVEVSCR